MSGSIIEKIQNIFRKNEDEIEPNISKLPDKIGRYKVIIQYAPPKGLSPCEVGFLYYRKFKDTDLDAILYDWAYKGFISISSSNKSKRIKKLKDFNSIKDYERYCWRLLFNFEGGLLHKMSLKGLAFYFSYNKIGLKILDYCKSKGRLTYEAIKPDFTNLCVLLILSPLLLFLGFCVSSIAVGGSILGGFIFLIIAVFILYKVFTYDGVGLLWVRSISLTDEGEKLLAHIYGYKYYLEKCEEEQFKNLMEEDPTFLDKTLPYIIALRLNPYFLKNKSIFHDEGANIITIAK